MSNIKQLSGLIWSASDDVLRGVFKPSEYSKVILPFVVMRRLDCVLEPKKSKVIAVHKQHKDLLNSDDLIMKIKKETNSRFYNVSKFDLQRLLDDQNHILRNFRNYINGYSDNVTDIIEHFAIIPLLEKLDKHKRLSLLISKFVEIDMHLDAIDNHTMGSVYEELLRRFSEMENEESGDHFTPRDVVQLLVALVFSGESHKFKGARVIRSIYDPCCGTGGMLTIGKEWVNKNIDKSIKLKLYGQEISDSTYAICKSDLLMLGEDESNIRGPSSSLADDKFRGEKFDYMITNPPYGVSWKNDKDFIEEENKSYGGRFAAGLPRISDGSLLFLQHLISKMRPEEGSRIGVVLNGSPLFSGDAGSGESKIREWIITEDLLECLVALPTKMFFNTGIPTYIWILNNKKPQSRKGKVQLIDGSSFFTSRDKNLGEKSNDISDMQINDLVKIYHNFKEGEHCQIHPNKFFGYTKVTIEHPLIEDGEVVKDKSGKIKMQREHERIPLSDDIEDYFNKEVKPYLPDAQMDRDKDRIGYEINFTKYFYKPDPLRKIESILKDLNKLDQEIKALSL